MKKVKQIYKPVPFVFCPYCHEQVDYIMTDYILSSKPKGTELTCDYCEQSFLIDKNASVIDGNGIIC